MHSVSLPGFYLAVGGIPDTYFFENCGSSGWAVVGTGIRTDYRRASMMTMADWRSALSRQAFDPEALDGHYVVLRWNGDSIECFTDQLGLRTVYFGKCAEGHCISTRLDWVAQATGQSGIDFASLGSGWLMLNQFSYASYILGIDRLGPGGYASFREGSLICSNNTPWLPSFQPGDAQGAIESLNALLESALERHHTISLGLSSGLDSRLLLACLIGSHKGRFVTHTFGEPTDPDVRIATKIAQTLGLEHQYYNEPLPDTDTCLSAMHSFVVQTNLVEPGSSFLKLRYFPKVREQCALMIDGGFGEIARRQFLNRVVRRGRTALQSKEIPRLLALMRSPRADIFSREVMNKLESGAGQSLAEALEAMPPLPEIGVENFADLFSVRMRIPNYGGPGQARLDAEILNFMPLAQPSFLRAVFRIPVKDRSNATFHTEIIGRLSPELKRFPSAKSGFTHRFGLSTNATWLLTKVKSRLTRGYCDPTPDDLLGHIREYVLDTAHSKDVITNSIYDSRKVLDAVGRYYHGELHLKDTVDWWLTFEIWRRSLQPGETHDDDAPLHEVGAGNFA
ncbi:MAG TPA: hypothetical protein VES59_03915 [Bacteroidota bacterium]|nr:hypothetical protein [Bacteroidota bacterium]